MHKFLIIQTAYTGDVVLATSVIEKVREVFPDAAIDFLLRKGNEQLLENNPHISEILIWNKQQNKKRNLARMILHVRSRKYTHVVNLHRFLTSGLVTLFSGAAYRTGFNKNPLSFGFTRKVPHIISPPYTPKPVHEVERNQSLIADIAGTQPSQPKLYPSVADRELIKEYQDKPYVCIAPSSIWFTKRLPIAQWIELTNSLPADHSIFVLGAPSDTTLAETIIKGSKHSKVMNMCGKLSYLQSTALMQGAKMNYTNDSGPMHFASASNAPVTAVYCSTEFSYGFGPLSDYNKVVEVEERLDCRPCGIHGHQSCPQGHFKCAKNIRNEQLLWWI